MGYKTDPEALCFSCEHSARDHHSDGACRLCYCQSRGFAEPLCDGSEMFGEPGSPLRRFAEIFSRIIKKKARGG